MNFYGETRLLPAIPAIPLICSIFVVVLNVLIERKRREIERKRELRKVEYTKIILINFTRRTLSQILYLQIKDRSLKFCKVLVFVEG